MNDVRIAQHQALLKSLVRKYAPIVAPTFTTDDLFSVGMEALWRCSLKWRDGMNVTFGQYARHVIKNAMRQLVITAKRNKRQVVLLSTSLDDDGEESTWDLESPDPGPFELLESKRRVEVEHKRVTRALKLISFEYRDLLRRRFIDGASLRQTGGVLGISYERVRQREAVALAKLKATYGRIST